MSEKKAPRTIPEIQSEYQSMCTRAGHIQYQIFTLEKDLALVNDTLRELNFEAAAASQAAAEAQKAQAESSPPKLEAVPSEESKGA